MNKKKTKHMPGNETKSSAEREKKRRRDNRRGWIHMVRAEDTEETRRGEGTTKKKSNHRMCLAKKSMIGLAPVKEKKNK